MEAGVKITLKAQNEVVAVLSKHEFSTLHCTMGNVEKIDGTQKEEQFSITKMY